MELKRIGEPRTIIENPDSKHNYFGWPSVARLQSGRLAVVCSGYRCGHVCPFGKTVMAVSEDEGEHWTGAWPVIDTPLDDRDGGIAVFGENGVIVTSFNNTLQAQRNWNPVNAELDAPHFRRNSYYHAYLRTVTAEEEARYLGATFKLSHDGGRTFGPLKKSPVTSPHGPLALADGTLLWVGRLFSPDDSFHETDRVLACRIGPEGETERIGAIPPVYRGGSIVELCEPHAVQLPSGRLVCHLRSEGAVPFTLFQSVSDDNGKTWTAPEQLLPEHGGAPAHLLLHSSGLLLSVYGYREPPYGVRVIASADGGGTWSDPETLYTGVHGDLGYPCSVELPDGSLLTVFYARDVPEGPCVIKQMKWEIAR